MSHESTPIPIVRSLQDSAMSEAIITNARYRKKEEEALHEAWPYPSRPLHEFEYAFEKVYPPAIAESGTLKAWLEKQKKPLHILNFMGSTKVLEDLYFQRTLTQGVAVCLSNIEQPVHKEMDISVIDGDVLVENTWERLRARMKKLNIDGFTLIFSYPQRGNTNMHVTSHLDVAWEIHNRLYTLLRPGGVLLAEASESMLRNHIGEEFVFSFQQQAGDKQAKYKSGYFSLVKTDAVSVLPSFPTGY